MEENDRVTLTNVSYGISIEGTLRYLLTSNKGDLEIRCKDGIISCNPLPFQIFTKLILKNQENMDFSLICDNVEKTIVQKSLKFLSTGFVNCIANHEKQSIIKFLKDISFLGYFENDNCIFNNSNISENSNMKHENECHVKCEIFEEKYISEEESPNIKTTVSPNIDRFNGSDFEETVETSDQENDNELRPKRKKRKSLGSRISLKLRLQQYPHLMEFKSRAICKVCKILLDWTKRCRVNDHMKSQKHLNQASLFKLEDFQLTDKDRLKLDNQIKLLENSNQIYDNQNNETSEKTQGKLGQRLKDYPWLEKIPNLEEAECVFCRCIVGWQRKSHILDHARSKKHIKAIEECSEKSPHLLNRTTESQTEQVKMSDRTSYRIVLKQGTPSIQKLWCAAILTNSSCIQSEVSICFVCLKLFTTNPELVKHSKLEHQGLENKLLHSPIYKKDTKAFFCNGCNKYTEAKKSILSFLVHNLICRKMFYTVANPVQCLACLQRFTEYRVFREHLESVHATLLPERLMCSDCPHTFLTNDELKRHVNQVHSEQHFSCTECVASFRNRKSLKDHVVKQHIGVKNFSCDECGKEFYGKNNLRMHMRIHVAPENRPHGCDTCGLRFIDRKHLLNHQATHTNERPHFCQICDARFKVRDWLSSHYIKHHNISIKEVESKFKQNGNQRSQYKTTQRNSQTQHKNKTPNFDINFADSNENGVVNLVATNIVTSQVILGAEPKASGVQEQSGSGLDHSGDIQKNNGEGSDQLNTSINQNQDNSNDLDKDASDFNSDSLFF